MTKPLAKSSALVPMTLEGRRRTGYPEPLKQRVAGREKRALGDALGLVNFGVNLTRLEPGAQSALRHWHTQQDEFVWILEGEAILVTDRGRENLKAGMCAGFPKGRPDGHHLINESGKDVWFIEVGDRNPGDAACYPDDDLAVVAVSTYKYTKKDGTPV